MVKYSNNKKTLILMERIKKRNHKEVHGRREKSERESKRGGGKRDRGRKRKTSMRVV